MDPQVKSIVGTILGYAAAATATWGVARGLVPEADKAAFVNIIVTAVPLIVAAGVAEYKRRTASPAGLVQSIGNTKPEVLAKAADQGTIAQQSTLIQTVNKSENGVKVVDAAAPVRAVNEPQKGTTK